jgi:hypothetical protein
MQICVETKIASDSLTPSESVVGNLSPHEIFRLVPENTDIGVVPEELTMNYKALLITCLTAGVAAASEKPVKFTELPVAVRQSVERETKGASLRGLSRETENGKVCYEAETIVNGRHRDILFNESGNVVETEEQVSLDSIPAGARTAIEKYAAGGKVLTVEAVTRDTSISYEAQVQKAGKKSEVKVSPEGAVLK